MLRDKLQKSLEKAVETLGLEVGEVKLEHPAEAAHGDYSSNIALAIFSKFEIRSTKSETTSKFQISKFKTPLELAEAIALEIGNRKLEILDRVEVAPPGFVNFWLSPKTLSRELEQALTEGERYAKSEVGKGKTMLVDHSHPNIAKRFGIGHLRSTIIGQAIVKLYRSLGWEVIADNFLGDWGTQFGALIAQIKKEHDSSSAKITPRKGASANQKLKELTIDDLEELYVEFNKEAQDNPELWEEARSWFRKLEKGDPEAKAIWQAAKQQSMQEFERIWELLNVHFDQIHPESFFQDKIAPVLEDAKRKGLAKEDQGALIVRIPNQKTPLILVKSDGATTYETRDLAAIRFWTSEYKPDKIVYEVGADQTLHFKQVFAIAEMLGYAKEENLVHVKHGLYRFAHGKMRTRTGETVKLEQVLEEAVRRALALQTGPAAPSSRPTSSPSTDAQGAVTRRDSLRSRHPSDEKVARAVGIGAVKYFDLLHHPSTDIVFDWEKIFVLEGNSAPYLQYTYARTQSVLRKAIGNRQKALVPSAQSLVPNPEELAILRHFYRFPEVGQDAAYTFSPNLLCNFLFDLAQRYNTFYNQHRILGNPGRLALTEVTGNILKSGLNILGIDAPEKM